jgi:L-2-hydroxyglutarate oxidase LhgO
MQTDKKNTFFLFLLPILSGLTFLLPGCTVTKEPGKFTLQTGPVQAMPYQPPQQANEQQPATSVEKRFIESALQGPTAVESAIELSEKYAQVSEEAALLRQKNQELTAKNLQFKDRLAAMDIQLQQTQKELNQANDLLIEMRVELNNWKTNIIGFRGEMRNAEKAQLEALLKILEILGGEIKDESAEVNQDKGADLTTALSAIATHPQSQQIGATIGESNE